MCRIIIHHDELTFAVGLLGDREVVPEVADILAVGLQLSMQLVFALLYFFQCLVGGCLYVLIHRYALLV